MLIFMRSKRHLRLPIQSILGVQDAQTGFAPCANLLNLIVIRVRWRPSIYYSMCWQTKVEQIRMKAMGV